MSIVGGLDIHRKQLTFDYLDTVSGQVSARAGRARGPGAPARLAGPVRRVRRRCRVRDRGLHRVAVRRRGGWPRPGSDVHLADPADTAFARGRKRHAKTDKTDSPAPAAAAGRGPAARVLDPARAGPGSAGRCWRPTTTCAASTPPGCSGSTRCSSTRAPRPSARAPCAAPTGWPRRGRPPPRTCRRPGSGRSPPPWP